MTTRLSDTIRIWAISTAAPADTTLFFATLLVVSMAVSPFLLAMAMWGLVVTAFWQVVRETPRGPERRWWRILVRSFRNLFHQPACSALLLLLLVPVASGLWSEDHAYWLERVRVRLPFLVLPWVFANLPRLGERRHRLLLYILVWAMAVMCVGVAINFFLHETEIMHAMYQGRPMPVPRNHIRFSLMVATSVLAGAWLWQNRFFWRYAGERMALAVVVVFLFGFAHFLAVRSGLIALYAALFFLAVRWAWRSRRWGVALAAGLAAVCLFWGAVRTVPSLRQKWAYTVYDWQQYRQGAGATYSDSERWISMKSGWLIWQEHPWIGVGTGDLPKETEKTLTQYFPRYQGAPKLPHNQFLYLLAGTGLSGLCFSLFAFLYPVFAHRDKRALFYAFQVMVLASFLVEYTIETAMGVAWYLFFTLWLGGSVRDIKAFFKPTPAQTAPHPKSAAPRRSLFAKATRGAG
ncbi:MAG: O-antigen ligase family protein [Saprospiraceae bacterium]